MTSAILLGLVGTLIVDIFGSFASRRWKFNYANFAPLSFLIYAAVGALAGLHRSLFDAALAAGIVGLFDATVGWRISWLIGPGKPPPSFTTKAKIARTIATVLIAAAAVGIVGYSIATYL